MTAPNQIWVADITYVPTAAGFLYLAVVLDVFSRRIIGWSMQDTLHTTVVLDALDMAAAQRRATHVIHHSDQGSQCGSFAFGQRCQLLGVRPSMGSRGDAYDNAMAESFFSTLECEWANAPHWRSNSTTPYHHSPPETPTTALRKRVKFALRSPVAS